MQKGFTRFLVNHAMLKRFDNASFDIDC